MSNIDWTQMVTAEMKQAAIDLQLRHEQVLVENQWREDEFALIADQLLRIEDDDPTMLPGTAAQWRAYRIKVRAWVDGATDFPDSTKRPVQPK